MAWERLAHVELSSEADVIDTGTFTAKKNLRVICYVINSGSITNFMRFNSDSGNNYARNSSNDGGTNVTATSEAQYDIGQVIATYPEYSVTDITNITDKEKLCITHKIRQNTAGAGNAPKRLEVVGKWSNTSNQITSIQVHNNQSGSYAAGSYITVLGAKEAVTSDTMSVTDMTAKKHLMVQVKTIASGTATPELQFNGDTGNNYTYRRSQNGGTDTTVTSNSSIRIEKPSPDENCLCTVHIINEASKEKLTISEGIRNPDGAANAPGRFECTGKWTNTSNQITRVDVKNTGTGDFAEGSEVTVYGTD